MALVPTTGKLMKNSEKLKKIKVCPCSDYPLSDVPRLIQQRAVPMHRRAISMRHSRFGTGPSPLPRRAARRPLNIASVDFLPCVPR
jgi:hypothetical protein